MLVISFKLLKAWQSDLEALSPVQKEYAKRILAASSGFRILDTVYAFVGWFLLVKSIVLFSLSLVMASLIWEAWWLWFFLSSYVWFMDAIAWLVFLLMFAVGMVLAVAFIMKTVLAWIRVMWINVCLSAERDALIQIAICTDRKAHALCASSTQHVQRFEQSIRKVQKNISCQDYDRIMWLLESLKNASTDALRVLDPGREEVRNFLRQQTRASQSQKKQKMHACTEDDARLREQAQWVCLIIKSLSLEVSVLLNAVRNQSLWMSIKACSKQQDRPLVSTMYKIDRWLQMLMLLQRSTKVKGTSTTLQRLLSRLIYIPVYRSFNQQNQP